MNQYDSNVQKVMDFLMAEGYGAPEISIHRVCYRNFKTYLQDYNCGYNKEIAREWQEKNAKIWPEWRIKKNRICLMQLDDVYSLGYPRKYHPYENPVWYFQLSNMLRDELDVYMANFNSANITYCKMVKMECSNFLLFIQRRGKISIAEVDYDDVSAYFYHESNLKESTKASYILHTRDLLRFYAIQGCIKNSIYLMMNTLFIHKVISIDNFKQEDVDQINELKETSRDFPAAEMWFAVSEFNTVLEEHLYSKTIKRCAKFETNNI